MKIPGLQAQRLTMYGFMAIGFIIANRKYIAKAKAIGQSLEGGVLIKKAIGKTAHEVING